MSQLLEEILSKDNMTQAYKKVKANKVGVEPMESEWMKSMIISERIGRPSRKKSEIGNTVLNQCEG